MKHEQFFPNISVERKQVSVSSKHATLIEYTIPTTLNVNCDI